MSDRFSPIESTFGEKQAAYAEENNPALSSRLEKIGNAVGLIYEHVPLEEKVWQDLLKGSGELGAFDFADFKIDEVSDPMNPDEPTAILQRFSKSNYIEPESNGQRVSRQFHGLREYFQKVFRLSGILSSVAEDEEMFQDFAQQITEHPSLPFLIISGHGNTVDGRWQIGESSGQHLEDLSKVVAYFTDREKYSAILIEVCNPNGEVPAHLEGIPIYYVQGSSGVLQERQALKA